MADSLTGRSPELDRLCIDAIKILAMDAVQKANSGHPGTPMALAPLGCVRPWPLALGRESVVRVPPSPLRSR